ncbi:unnamed protein product [Paramecium octaurelia]|uniref:Uncharacterized protein n=1 Tax=Paramecium octaurelia TaxID=43137 RepID=A0A8S1XRA8_PAROT|nr:unnamed protein product [Paramecium octaurelia]
MNNGHSKSQQNYCGNNNEYLSFEIDQAFHNSKDFADYELIDHNNKLQLNQPIQLLSSGIVDETQQDNKIIKFDGVQRKDRYWPNQYGILRIVKNQYELIYNLEQWYSNEDRMPKFDKSINIGSTDQIICYDFVWITSKSVIIDCIEMIDEVETNYFYIFQIGDQIKKSKILNDYPYSKNQERQLYIQSKYLYRVTKKNQYNNQNQVEMFQYNSETLELTNLQQQIANFLQIMISLYYIQITQIFQFWISNAVTPINLLSQMISKILYIYNIIIMNGIQKYNGVNIKFFPMILISSKKSIQELENHFFMNRHNQTIY